MKAVMISIRPEWVAKILSGEKTVEVRKTAPKLKTPFKCYIYETQGKTDTPWVDEEGHTIFRGRGQVVAEFICNRIEEFTTNYYTMNRPQTLRIARSACLGLAELTEYEGNALFLYGWHISELKIYDKPKNLREFFYPCEKRKYPYCFDCEHGLQKGEERPIDGMRHYDVPCGNWVKRPPQSWCYVEEL